MYVVEGYMDVISLWQVGVKNVVAACGTSVTEGHIKRLGNLAHRIKLLFDADKAGRAAAAKVYPLTINSGVDFSVVFLPEGDDPDSIAQAKRGGTSKYLESLGAKSLFEVYLESCLSSYAGSTGSLGASSKGKLAKEVAQLLSRIDNEIERGVLVESASAKIGIEAVALHSAIQGEEPVFTSSVQESEKKPQSEQTQVLSHGFLAIEELDSIEKELLRLIIIEKSLAERFLKSATVVGAVQPQVRQFVEDLWEITKSDISNEKKKELVRRELEAMGESWLVFWKECYLMHDDVDKSRLDESFSHSERLLKRNSIQKQLLELIRQEKSIKESAGDEQMRVQLAQEKLNLSRLLDAC